MPIQFRFPDVGEGITEGEIARWRVKIGDKVKLDQVLVEVETDKAVVQLPSPATGKILKIFHRNGDKIKVGEILVEISGEGKIEKSSKSVIGELKEGSYTIPSPIYKKIAGDFGFQALPSVRKLALKLGVDLSKINPTGKRITEEDVRSAAINQNPPPTTQNPKPKTQGPKTKNAQITKKYDMWGYVDRIPLRGVRKSIADNMVLSVKTAAHVTHMDMADVTELVAFREKKKQENKKTKLTFLPFIVKAVAAALKKHPFVNSSMDNQTGEIMLKKYYNIGVAVDTDGGLMVPVIKGADKKGIFEIAKESENLAEKTRKRKIDLMDLRGGTFTITNVGSFGGIFATPIINHMEAAILATGRIHERPVAKGGKVFVRWVLPLSLSFDHRIFDGAEAARFVNSIKEFLSKPEKL